MNQMFSRCLTEGVDVPIIDSVYFVNPKHSLIDIVQACGRALRKPRDKHDKIAYWYRDKKGASSEVDFVIQKGSSIIPIEVKSGKAGTLRSLHQFVDKADFNFKLQLRNWFRVLVVVFFYLKTPSPKRETLNNYIQIFSIEEFFPFQKYLS